MRIRFWGTRGSLAKPGPSTLRYGGNTPCVEVTGPEDTTLVLDCGTGAHELGQHLMAAGSPVRAHLLITHTHWDHIQGIPFFAPLFVPGNEWDVYAPQGLNQRLEQTLAGQMEYAYFPVSLAQLGATIRYHEVGEETFDIGAIRVVTRYLNHPGLAIAYRLEVGGNAVVYSTDHEPHSSHQPDPSSASAEPVHHEDRRHIEYLAGADLVIHDAQYTLAEYPAKRTWGHCPAELAVDWAAAGGVKRLALFHHDPLRHDEALDRLLAVCRRRAKDRGSPLEVFAAAEGQVVELLGSAAASPAMAPLGKRVRRPSAATILIVDDDPDIVHLLKLTLGPEGFRLLSAGDGRSALAMARAEMPDLVLLDWQMPHPDGLDVCRALRADGDQRLRDLTIVLLTAQAEEEDMAAGFAAGVTDYMTKPFKPSHVVARVHAWLLRGSRASA